MTDPDTRSRILNNAIRAPSSHNTQPWIFSLAGDDINLFADRTRALPANDPDDRELTISCGCALMALRVAAAGEGCGTRIALLPDKDDPDLLARITLNGDPESGLAPLAPLLAQRQTYRKGFDGRPVPEDARDALIAAATAEGAWLVPVEDDADRHKAADLVARGDEEQWGDPAWRRELAAWMHPRRTGDGLTLPWLTIPVAQLVVRSFDMGNGVAARDGELAEHSPLLAVLGTDGDTVADWLVTGQALQNLLLTGVHAGLQGSYLNQPVQVSRLRPELGKLAGKPGHPQILLRMGYPEEILPLSPRRRLKEVVENAPGPSRR